MKKDIDATTGSHENSAHQGVCPNCGFCPTCGRSNAQPFRVVPYPIPTWPVYPTYPWRPYTPGWIAGQGTWTGDTPGLSGVTNTFSVSASSPALAD